MFKRSLYISLVIVAAVPSLLFSQSGQGQGNARLTQDGVSSKAARSPSATGGSGSDSQATTTEESQSPTDSATSQAELERQKARESTRGNPAGISNRSNTLEIDADNDPAKSSDPIHSPAISEPAIVSRNIPQSLLDRLPSGRGIISAVALASGSAITEALLRPSISGAQTYDNFYTLDGLPINENLRGQPGDLFIEDAIAETVVSTAGVSAEYGRFTGGIINTVTRRGGNELHASFRDTLESEKWQSQTPAGETRGDSVDNIFELTLGGFLVKDRLWFFAAGRDLDREGIDQTVFTRIPYPTSQDERRLQANLTFSLTANQQLNVSALDVDDRRSGNTQRPPLDLGAINNDTSLPEELFTANYTGLLSTNFLVEASASERSSEFLGIGGTDHNPFSGTPFIDLLTGANYHQPIFCGDCANADRRESEYASLKGSYFLDSRRGGSHDLVFGLDTYNDIRIADNQQSATDFQVRSLGTIFRDGEVFPVMIPGSLVIRTPVLQSSLGTDFRSNSAYVNDRWEFGKSWSFNLGLRYDENDGRDSAGVQVADGRNLSPRLGLSFDPKGDGGTTFHASAGRYVTRLANTVANQGSVAGAATFESLFYTGPSINADSTSDTLISADDALDIIFRWYIRETRFLPSPSFPNVPRIDGSLLSPNVDELTFGVSQKLGTRGSLQADYVHRDFGDFYLLRTADPGTSVNFQAPFRDSFLLQNNDDILERTYDGLQTSFQYRILEGLSAGGTWTWSHARGNFDGESRGAGPIASRVGEYPEFKAFDAHNPRGDLAVDQRHKARLWLLWDALDGENHHLDVSLLQSYSSGTPFGARGAVSTLATAAAPRYVSPPSSVAYFYTGRDFFHTDDITRTDLSLNYSFLWPGKGRKLEIFLQPEVFNLFNESGLVAGNRTVLDATNTSGLQRFDPFSETPQRGVHWDLGPEFGQARNDRDYQRPRTFRLSIGIRI